MKTPLETLRNALNEHFVWVNYTADDEPIDTSIEESHATESLTLDSGLSSCQLSALETHLPAPLPSEFRNLLKNHSGFSLGGFNVSFTRYNDWNYGYLLPNVMVLTDDGSGNDWVIEIHPVSGQWRHVWFQCHDPPVLMYQCETLCELIDGVMDLSRFEKCQAGHRSILHSDRTHSASQQRFQTAAKLRGSTDTVIQSFIAELPDNATVIDLRNPRIGDGFSILRIPREHPLKRHGQELLFAYTRKPTLWQRLIGNFGK